MPGKNVIKINVENGYYHVYNRGVEKRIVFEDKQDYKVFLKYLKEYLSPPPDLNSLRKTITLQGSTFKGVPRQVKNHNKSVKLISYCLMPNHFHLLIMQKDKNDLKNFMRSLMVRYTMYFNKKYKRVGRLFQGVYKARLIRNDSDLLHLSRYIHLNPNELTADFTEAYSSYPEYLGTKKTKWVHPNIVLKFFENSTIPEIEKCNSYKKFVENSKINSRKKLGQLTLE